MGKLIARLRAWLVDIVREAIRIEHSLQQPEMFIRATPRVLKPASKPVTDPTDFDQMLAESIQKQEKYYEPERL